MKFITKLILKIWGWKVIGGIVPEKKFIVLGVPHTSIWDFVISYVFYTSVGGKANVFVKKELFFWPLGYLVKAMGGIPLDRSKGTSMVKQVVDEFKKRDALALAIAPEGTRQPTDKWKGGFHLIARAANVPVYYGFFDWGRKEVGFVEKVEITDNLQADLKKIRQWYKDRGVVGKYPEQFITGDDLD
jgi:1-acyl-sn-glycerol-3-phosphate acyltransferase